MASTVRRTRPPNADLARLIEAGGASHKSLALRVNQLAHAAGTKTDYSHTSVANWCRRGMMPKRPVPRLLARALSERLGRPVNLADIGMGEAETIGASVGLDLYFTDSRWVRIGSELRRRVAQMTVTVLGRPLGRVFNRHAHVSSDARVTAAW